VAKQSLHSFWIRSDSDQERRQTVTKVVEAEPGDPDRTGEPCWDYLSGFSIACRLPETYPEFATLIAYETPTRDAGPSEPDSFGVTGVAIGGNKSSCRTAFDLPEPLRGSASGLVSLGI
jgi:hypothetical protein